MKIFSAAALALSASSFVAVVDAQSYTDASGGAYCYDATNKLCGPLIWDQLDIPDNQCGGSRNSPIAIETEPLGECEQLDYKFDRGGCRFGDLKYDLLNDVIKASYPDTCVKPSVTIGNLKYDALQFHIHLNSEHSLNGRFFSAEFHIVHGLATEDATAEPFAVIGFMMESGSVLGYFDPTVDGAVPGWIATAKNVTGECGLPDPDYFYEGTTKPSYFVNPYSLLPPGPQFFQYNGGLTTPPCTEAVWWNLLTEPVQIGVAQMDTLDRLILGYVSPETCEFASNADPYTGSTSRPPIDPIGRDIKIKGPFCHGASTDTTTHSTEDVEMMEEAMEEEEGIQEEGAQEEAPSDDPTRRGLRA